MVFGSSIMTDVAPIAENTVLFTVKYPNQSIMDCIKSYPCRYSLYFTRALYQPNNYSTNDNSLKLLLLLHYFRVIIYSVRLIRLDDVNRILSTAHC